MFRCLIGLGSNVGDRCLALSRAIDGLRDCARIELLAVSSFHETAPVGGPAEQSPFLNAAALLATDLSPHDLLGVLQGMERQMGRVRHERWGSRIVDLDLLLYGDLILCTPELMVPHPRMTFRRFVLVPAAEIAGEVRHPVVGCALREFLEHLDSAPNYIAIFGATETARRELVASLAGKVPVRWVSKRVTGDESLRRDTGSAGSALRTEIEFLHRCVGCLDPATHVGSLWCFSDFWLRDVLMEACHRLDTSDGARYEKTWYAEVTGAMEPKLVVFWNELGETVAGSRERAEVDRRRAMLAGQGPYLEMTGTDLEWAVVEVRAAMDAIQ